MAIKKKVPTKAKTSTKNKPAVKKTAKKRNVFFPGNETVIEFTQVTVTVTDFRKTACEGCPDDKGKICRKTMCQRRKDWLEGMVGVGPASKGGAHCQFFFSGNKTYARSMR